MSEIKQLFIEVILIVKGRQIQTFYGPFFWEQDRDSFRDDLMRADKAIYNSIGDESHNPARIKYLSCNADSVPRVKWETVPLEHFPGTFYWYKKEDVGDWQPR